MLSLFNTLVGIGTIIVLVAIVGIYIMMFLGETQSKLFRFFRRNAYLLAFLLALGGMAGSLIYSELFHFVPCDFCWWQRIFIYPQVIVLAVGMKRHELSSWISATWLSAIGICFSIYNILIQTGVVGVPGDCAISGVSCAKIDVTIFGWLTIPIMCLILFAGILTLSFVANRKNA